MENHIAIHSLRLYARHGVLEQEQTLGAWFLVDVDLTASFLQAMLSDTLEGTVSYADVYDVIRKEMQTPSRLIEHAGGRIVRALFLHFPQVTRIGLRLTKETPPVTGMQCVGCSISIDMERKEFETLFC